MKLVKAETDIVPLSRDRVIISDYIDDIGTRFEVIPINDGFNLPNTSVFDSKPRSYIFGVFMGHETWFQVKFEDEELVFDLPGEVLRNKLTYQDNFGIFMGYNNGFLGASFKPGFYSPRQRVLYWYSLAKTKLDVQGRDYFVYGIPQEFPVLVDLSDYLTKPGVTGITSKITIGSGIIIGGGNHINDDAPPSSGNLILGDTSNG